MNCKICNTTSSRIFKSIVLNKYDVTYFKCEKCGFIQTEKPYWLKEAYASPIASLDVGLVSRNLGYSPTINKIIFKHFDYTGKFLDFAGGYGLFVRLMRDKGFDFFRQDEFCENIFAKHFDIQDMRDTKSFELITAIEAFEHFEEPIKEIDKMFKLSDTVLFSTEIQPNISIKSINDWWYFTPDTGQHISFYTIEALEELARHFKCNIYSNATNLHMLSFKKFTQNPLIVKDSFILKKLKRLVSTLEKHSNKSKKLPSLISRDFETAKTLCK